MVLESGKIAREPSYALALDLALIAGNMGEFGRLPGLPIDSRR